MTSARLPARLRLGVMTLLAPLLLALPASRADAREAPVSVSARPVETFASDGRRQIGLLEFRGGLVLAGDDPAFGGISGLTVDAGGESFLAITDRGNWVRGRILTDGDRPTGLADVVIAPMLAANGRTLRSRGTADTEALTRTAQGYAVAVERRQEVLGFAGPDPLDAKAKRLAGGGPLDALGSNQGPEALAWLPAAKGKDRSKGGSLVIVAEKSQTDETVLPGFILTGGKLAPFTLRRHPDYDATDLAIAPDGTAYLLERRFTWTSGVGMRVRRFLASAIAPGAVIDPELIFEAGRGAQIDNMEALAVHVNAAGETILTAMSDDNFSPLQRTLLLRFAVLPAAD